MQKILITYRRTKSGVVKKFITVTSLTSNDDRNADIVSDLIQDYCDGKLPYWHRFELLSV